MAEAKTEETVGEDRISELPEDLLVEILGLVPTKDAVATMFLSKRWFSIWTLVRILRYKEIEIEDDDDESKKSIWWFLNKSLELHKAPVIDDLYVELGRRCPADVDVGKWVAHAVGRLVKRLELNLLWSSDPTSLPNSIYSCESLVELTLSHQILVDVPSSACLPSLIDLDLNRVLYKDEDSLVRFLSNCPVLEFLTVRREKYDNVKKFAVKVPSLWELWYSHYSSAENSCLVVDAPELHRCKITDFSGGSCSFKDMPCLEHAHLDIVSYHDDAFLSFSSVLSLDLYTSDAMVMVMRFSTINFSQLNKLSIYPCQADWLEPLVLLLGNAPNLKELLVDYEYVNIGLEDDDPFSWNQPSLVPGCLSSQLQTFEWREYWDRVEEEEFLTYILANSKCLNTVTISLRPTIDLDEQELIKEELKDIPRVSTTSRLLFK